jgi:hypothetical protein
VAYLRNSTRKINPSAQRQNGKERGRHCNA